MCTSKRDNPSPEGNVNQSSYIDMLFIQFHSWSNVFALFEKMSKKKAMRPLKKTKKNTGGIIVSSLLKPHFTSRTAVRPLKNVGFMTSEQFMH